MAKHWKSFVKKEKASPQENEEIKDIASLLSPNAKKSDKSLEDVAEFNSSLKSLIEEQKQLEDQMAELTGKKKSSNTDKRYEHEIKTIDQKKKEEAAAEAKRKKRQESHRKQKDDRWEVTPSFNKKRKEEINIPPVSKQRKKATPNTDFIQKKNAAKPSVRIPEIRKKSDPSLVSKKKKPSTSLLAIEQKVRKAKKTVDDFTKRPKKSVAKVVKKAVQKPPTVTKKAPKTNTQKPKRQQQTLLQQAGKRIKETPLQPKRKVEETVSNTVKKGAKKLDLFVNNAAKKKEVQTVKTVVKKASKAIDTFDTIGKKVSEVNDTYQTVRTKGNELQTGIAKVASVVKSPELQSLNKKVSKGVGIVNKVGNKLNKVDQLFNTANKKLEKTQSVTNLFQKKLNSVDFISGADAKTNNAFDFGFIQQQETKKEETASFNVGNKKLNVITDVIKTAQNVKKGMDIIKDVKKQKDSFAL